MAAVATALLDDLNTPSAVAALSAPLKAINDLLFTKAGKKQQGRLASLAGLHQGIHQVRCALGAPGLQQGAWLLAGCAAAGPRCLLAVERCRQAVELHHAGFWEPKQPALPPLPRPAAAVVLGRNAAAGQR
jgi:cysteinyl-tRNA synthetase